MHGPPVAAREWRPAMASTKLRTGVRQGSHYPELITDREVTWVSSLVSAHCAAGSPTDHPATHHWRGRVIGLPVVVEVFSESGPIFQTYDFCFLDDPHESTDGSAETNKFRAKRGTYCLGRKSANDQLAILPRGARLNC